MVKVIITIAAENGMCVDEICSFKTENYIGIWSHSDNDFMLIEKSGFEFHPRLLTGCDCLNNLKELDDKVFNGCEEHILEVFDNSPYTFGLGN